jgi:hypothetical protein
VTSFVSRVALLMAIVAAVGVAAPAVADDSPIDASRQASRTLRFEGVVRVEWVDAGGRHVERVKVRSWNGTMAVEGATDLAATDRARFVYHRGLGWAMVWPAELASDDRPSPDAKYRVVAMGPGPTVAGRSTNLVEVRRGSVRCELVYTDAKTGLVLRREQYDPAGDLRRTVTFETLETNTTPVSLPARVADKSPDTVPGMSPSAPYRAPAALGSGYELIGAYRQSGTVHLLYSDGIYDLSVFEQRGRLDRDGLPTGRRHVTLAGRDAWQVSWPGGDVVVWQAGGAVFTAVGEAPIDDVLAAAGTMPSAGQPSLVEKLRRMCGSLLDVFSRG